MQGVTTILSHAQHAWGIRGLWTVLDLARLAHIGAVVSRSRGASLPAPLAVAWYLTWSCPADCPFCDVRPPGGALSAPLDAARLLQLADRLAPWAPVHAIGGGEPLTHPGILPFLRRLGERGARRFVATNGVLLPVMADDLLQAGVEVVNVSILGDEQAHDSLVRLPGAWRAAVEGVQALVSRRRKHRPWVAINAAITLENHGALDTIVRLGRSIGVDHVRFSWLSFLTAAEQGDSPGEGLMLAPDGLAGFDPTSLVAATDEVEARYGSFVSFRPRLSRLERLAWYREGGGVVRPCFSLFHTMFLRPDGAVVPCGHLLSKPVGNALDRSPDDLWNDPALRTLRGSGGPPRMPVCRRCCKL